MNTQYAGVIMMAALFAAIGLCSGLYALGARRMRDPRLDRNWSDDEAAPYDSPASLNPRMDTYMRMLDEDRPPKY